VSPRLAQLDGLLDLLAEAVVAELEREASGAPPPEKRTAAGEAAVQENTMTDNAADDTAGRAR